MSVVLGIKVILDPFTLPFADLHGDAGLGPQPGNHGDVGGVHGWDCQCSQVTKFTRHNLEVTIIVPTSYEIRWDLSSNELAGNYLRFRS